MSHSVQPFTPDPISRQGRASGPDALVLHELRKSFGAVHAVAGVSLTVPAGQIVAMLGPNGAGKSTLNEMIVGLAVPDDGSVAVFARPPAAAISEGLVGAMLQNGALLDQATTLDVLRLMHGLHRHPLPLDDVIERADVSEFLRTRTERLSGGQAQRLRYALAIMPDPQLLILDEPTVAMDVQLRRRFWQSMREFVASGRTVLFATHYLDEADEVADRVVLLAHGRIVADGTGAQIKASVGGRMITVSSDLAEAVLRALPGVTDVEATGRRLQLTSSDSDATLRQLLAADPAAHDIEVAAPRLEDAFRELTDDTTHHATPHDNHEEAAA